MCRIEKEEEGESKENKKKHKIADTVVIYFSTVVERVHHQTKITRVRTYNAYTRKLKKIFY